MGQLISNVTDAVGITNHSGDAALQAQANASDSANATQLSMYNQTAARLSPYDAAGTGAVNQLSNSMPDLLKSYSGQDLLQNDPGYQFRMDQGSNAIQSGAAAKGALNSGATLKALTRYGQDYASGEYNNAYNRYNNDRQMKYNMLSTLAGLGENAAAQTGNAGSAAANQISSNQIGLGNAQAANDVAGTNRISGMINGGITGAVAHYSDMRVKKNIRPVSKEDLNEFKSTIKPYHYEYLDQKFGQGEHVGVMAQDLEKSKLGRLMVFTDTDGVKKIDLKKFASLILASLAEGAA